MPRAKRICPKPGCPKTVNKRYCTEHEQQYERERGTAHQRGYNSAYRVARKKLKPAVEAGTTQCWRCGNLIHPNTEWHLGHDDNDRSIIRGPEHPHCNTSAAGKKGRAMQN